jgi:lipid-A-disaccharide synthase
VIKKYGYFRKQFRETLKEIQESKPDAVVLIDYPGFNLRLADALRKQSPEQKIIYYISPQVWAWESRPHQEKWRAFWISCSVSFLSKPISTTNLAYTRYLSVIPCSKDCALRGSNIDRDPNLIGLFSGSRFARSAKQFSPLCSRVCGNFENETGTCISR